MNTGNERQLDIAFQIGASKAIRNVVNNALQTFSDYAFQAARNSLVDRIGANLDGWRKRTLEGIAKIPVELSRVERVIGRPAKDWLAPDVASIIAMMKAIADGMATVDETFPAPDKQVDGEEGGAAQSSVDQFAAGGAAAADTQAKNPADKSGDNPATPAKPEDDKGKKPATDSAKPDAGRGFVPTTEAQYVAHANAWREKITTKEEAAAAAAQWKNEKDMRNKANVSGDVRDGLKDVLDARIAELSK